MVDRLVSHRSAFSVVEESGRELNANLLCVEASHNKYYIMQVIRKNDATGAYIFYRRWGRCGTDGQRMQKEYTLLSDAVADFDLLLEEKLESYQQIHVTYP
eukprot:TRINITY_DN2307_c0_g1_i3.p2 TRINITY_DN2307_c0_g1~~TRINITY_DN2307_c0_g1_i3.p2  ORF type:complete len:101 (-),score=5.92 TRINITY_DN2307_c0_g1_i3:35-337(-)